MIKEIDKKIKQFSKCDFDFTQKHKVIASVEKNILTIEDTKFYKSKIRKDILIMSLADLEKRIAKIKLFDRKSFELEFSKEASEDLCCNSYAVTKNLANKNQQYSTCYRLLARFSNRADLLLMCQMSKAQQEKVFNSKSFNYAIIEQMKTLTREQITKSTVANANYKANAEKLKKIYLLKRINKSKVSKLILVKAKKEKSIA